MLIFGSSSVNGSFGRLMADELSGLGYQVQRHGHSAAGLARPDFRDMRQLLDQLPVGRNTVSVLLYVGGNDAQAIWLRPQERPKNGSGSPWVWWKDERWPGLYETRAVAAIESLCARGVRHVIVLAPADVVSERLQSRLERVRNLLQRATQSTSCGHFVATGGDVSALNQSPSALRTPDGTHMNSAGALRVWSRVRDKVLSIVRNSPEREALLVRRTQRR